MPISVSDSRSNPADQIAHAVEVLGRASDRISIFRLIYHGKKIVKTVDEIARAAKLSRIRVLQEGKKLSSNHIVEQLKIDGQTAYRKDSFYSAHKARILRLVKNPDAFAKLATKTRPQPRSKGMVVIQIPSPRVRARQISVDDVQSFVRVKGIKTTAGPYTAMSEAKFKKGVASILSESGKFHDWGGERNDLFTTRVRLAGKRIAAAFAFKGSGRKGVLTPGKMGKNGDQIQRLFKSAASIFFVQYWGQIAESVTEQMQEFARAKSAIEGDPILFGVIDGDDSNRLIKAYARHFQ